MGWRRDEEYDFSSRHRKNKAGQKRWAAPVGDAGDAEETDVQVGDEEPEPASASGSKDSCSSVADDGGDGIGDGGGGGKHSKAKAKVVTLMDAPLLRNGRGARPGSGRLQANRKESAAEQMLSVELARVRNMYVDLAFEAGSLGLADEVSKAASVFDERHRKLTTAARTHSAALHGDPTSIRREAAFGRTLLGVRRNRYRLAETYDPFGKVFEQRAAPPPVVKPWDLNDTFWRRRVEWCDAHAFLDGSNMHMPCSTPSPMTKTQKLDKIWKRALMAGLAKFIIKHDDGDSDDEDEDSGAVAVQWDSNTEVSDVRAEFDRNIDCFFAVFEVYAALGGSATGISLNDWTELIKDCELNDEKSANCKKSDLVLQFYSVDGGEVKDKVLGISEFLTAITRVAAMKYVMPGAPSAIGAEGQHTLAAHARSTRVQQTCQDTCTFI